MLKITPLQLHKTLQYDWSIELKEEFFKDYFNAITSKINQCLDLNNLCPPLENIFNAYNSTSLKKVKVVIIGQDPYHGKNQANGLAFAVNDKNPSPPSLKNIFKEIEADLKVKLTLSKNLKSWVNQGVLLLNSTLTVSEKIPNSHSGLGWERFTDKTLKLISSKNKKVVFILWGKHAEKKEILVDQKKHLILKSSHPSPLSAYRGFFGCKHFSKTNDFLIKNNLKPIDWAK